MKDFEADVTTFKASLAATCFAMASLSWLEDLRALKNRGHPDFGSILNKISLVTAFLADTSIDVMRFSARAIASS